MTDLEKMKQSFIELGVEHEVATAKERFGADLCKTDYKEITFDTIIVLERGVGYGCFECLFYFLQGKYQGHGVWE